MLPTDKLESLAARYREIEELLCQPNVVSDAKRYTGLTRERAELEDVLKEILRRAHIYKKELRLTRAYQELLISKLNICLREDAVLDNSHRLSEDKGAPADVDI